MAETVSGFYRLKIAKIIGLLPLFSNFSEAKTILLMIQQLFDRSSNLLTTAEAQWAIKSKESPKINLLYSLLMVVENLYFFIQPLWVNLPIKICPLMDWLQSIITSQWLPLIEVLLGALLIQLIYFWVIFSKLAFYNPSKRPLNENKEPVSVIICAKDEYHNLVRFLPRMLEQDYPEFEVVVVNDASDDDTFYLLRELSEKYSRLKVVNIPQNLNFFKGKKFPLSIGLKSAKYELVLLADADCFPTGPDWITSMQSVFTGNTEIVLGYGAYSTQPGLLNKFIRFDTLMVAMQYMSLALVGLPYMGVGRNLAYRKKIFFNIGGFIKHYKISSGDDDLFINQVAGSNNTRIQPLPIAHTYSKPKQSFASWFRQKKRHLTTGRYYRFSHKLVLGLFSLSRFVFFCLLVTLAILGVDWMLLVGLFLIRLITQLIIVKKCMIRLGEKHFLLLSPLIEAGIMLINFFLGIAGLFSRKTQW